MLASNYSGKILEAGLDEVGRGCLAGPVVAAAVILPFDYHHPLLTDSKKLRKHQREQLRAEIIKVALSWAVAEVSPAEVDRINISNASFAAMHLAVSGLKITPEYLIVDGNRFTPYQAIEHACLVKGDSKYFSIAAASVLAKTYRDDLMTALGQEYPHFGWAQNVGYPTLQHRQAIREHGTTPFHRLSFRLLPNNEPLNKNKSEGAAITR